LQLFCFVFKRKQESKRNTKNRFIPHNNNHKKRRKESSFFFTMNQQQEEISCKDINSVWKRVNIPITTYCINYFRCSRTFRMYCTATKYDMNIYVDWKMEEGIKEGSKVRNFLFRRIIELECVSNVELKNVIR